MPGSTLEDRVRRLEAFRYSMLGQINATRTVLFAVWHILLDRHFADPVGFVQQVRETWLKSAMNLGDFPGVDPAHLDAISQEYEKAIDDLTKHLLRIAEGQAKS